MKIIYAVLFVFSILSAQAQNGSGQVHTESVETLAVPPALLQVLNKTAPGFQEATWEHISCQQCGQEGAYSHYKAEFFQEDKPASLTLDETGKILAFQLRVQLANLPAPAQQVVSKRAGKMKQDYKGVELELYAFTAADKVLYNVVFFIPTEDKKHWTPYDEININDKGSLVKQLP
ncbi:MAG: hypothetical protein ACRYFV_02550 [Janthinobacterium lividum]